MLILYFFINFLFFFFRFNVKKNDTKEMKYYKIFKFNISIIFFMKYIVDFMFKKFPYHDFLYI